MACFRERIDWLLLACCLSAVIAMTAAAEPAVAQSVAVRFFCSETGTRIQPERVAVGGDQAGPFDEGGDESSVRFGGADSSALVLRAGVHQLSAAARGYRAVDAELVVDGPEAEPRSISVWLDPVEPPHYLSPERIRALHRADAMVIVGVIVDDETGEPLPGVRVSCQRTPAPAGQESGATASATWSDERGCFQMHVPLMAPGDAEEPYTSLVFARPGYRTQENQHIEMWANGDWTYRVRLPADAGESRTIVDERRFRRRPTAKDPAFAPNVDLRSGPLRQQHQAGSLDAGIGSVPAPTVRVPRSIRVLRPDGNNIDYVSLEHYCRRVLPAEWIASWGAYAGGENSLKAGAVVIRTYAVGAINKPRGSAYDICGTTACQVYGAVTSSYSDAAVAETADYLMLEDGGTVSPALTEYSAENNSLGLGCGDGFTAPVGGCLYDPVCAGESRYGHGRGLCQWGSAKWATGLKFPGNSTRDRTTLNGYPRRDWVWILQHYFPALHLAKAMPLSIGDPVKALTRLNVRACAGGTISDGINCPVVTVQSEGSAGVIVAGPTQVTSDGAGYNWYQVRWATATGWSTENYLDRVVALPAAPGNLVVSGVSTDRIDLSWSGTDGFHAGFVMERAGGLTGPWHQIATTPANTHTYSDTNLHPSSTWFFRVRAYNAAGHSDPSAAISATTSGVAPALEALPDQVLSGESVLTIGTRATAPGFVQVITDFETFPSETANGVVLFREPRFSPSTSGYLAAAPNLAAVTDVFAPRPGAGGRVLRINCQFTGEENAWLRLTTAQARFWPNPVINLAGSLRFELYADKPVGVAVGYRKTSRAAAVSVGSDGGTDGPIEWAGVRDVIAGRPSPLRVIAANSWTTCTFDFATEPIRAFPDGAAVSAGPSGLGVLEHLALVPLAGPGVYSIYVDAVAVLTPKTLHYSLESGAPPEASLHPTTGVITWTPIQGQARGPQLLTVRVTDNSNPPLSASQSFQIMPDAAPTLQARLSGGEVLISWTAAAGRNYVAEFTETLRDPSWTELPSVVTVQDGLALILDNPGGKERYYRVWIVP